MVQFSFGSVNIYLVRHSVRIELLSVSDVVLPPCGNLVLVLTALTTDAESSILFQRVFFLAARLRQRAEVKSLVACGVCGLWTRPARGLYLYYAM